MKPIQVSLSYKEGSSDKVYQAALEKDKKTDLWVVNFAYGRRGSAMQIGTKTTKPVDYKQAEKILSKLVNAKQSKGYKVDLNDDNVSLVQSPVERKQTGHHPQLLKAIEEADVESFLEDDDYIAQEKMDGVRKMIGRGPSEIIGINRKGEAVNVPVSVIEDITRNMDAENFLLDGEQIGDKYHVFDMLINKIAIKDLPYETRYKLLNKFIQECDFKNIHLVKAVSGFVPKSALYKQLLQDGKEGIVFKKKDAKYVPGRNSGTQFKHKFWESASFVVIGENAQRSVEIAVMNKKISGMTEISVGNVTIPVNHSMPKKGDIVEVRYLYAYREGSLIQPSYLGVRTDLDKSDCLASQLKYKSESND